MSANRNKQTEAMNNVLLLIKTSKSHVKSLSPRRFDDRNALCLGFPRRPVFPIGSRLLTYADGPASLAVDRHAARHRSARWKALGSHRSAPDSFPWNSSPGRGHRVGGDPRL